MIVGLDVDGVLADFFQVYEKAIAAKAGTNKFPPFSLPPVWNWPQHYGYSEEVVAAVWEDIYNSHTFWHNCRALPGAQSLLSRLIGHEVYFVTDRPGRQAQQQTQAWLLPYMPPGMMPAVIISRRGKGAVARALSLDVYVDDKPENVEDVWAKSPTTRVYMPKYPYNSRLHGCEGAVSALADIPL